MLGLPGQLHWWDRQKPKHKLQNTNECLRMVTSIIIIFAEHHSKTKHRINYDSSMCLTFCTNYYQHLTISESWYRKRRTNDIRPLPTSTCAIQMIIQQNTLTMLLFSLCLQPTVTFTYIHHSPSSLPITLLYQLPITMLTRASSYIHLNFQP